MIKKFANARMRGTGVLKGVRVVEVLAALVAAVFLFAGGARAGGFALSGVGSKAIGMGGAFRGLADDWSAAYWNPAGLTQLEKSEINAMLVAITAHPEYTPDIYYYGIDVGYRNGKTYFPNDKSIFIPDFSGFVKLPSMQDLTFGLAVYVPYGLGSEWNLFRGEYPAELGLYHAVPWYDHKADLKVIDFHPTVAKAFMDGKLSLGVGLSFQRGDVTFNRIYLKPSGLPVPNENLIINSVMEGDGWGVGGNFGILYKLSDKLQFGVSGRTGNTMKIKGSADQELYTIANNDLRTILLGQSYTAAESAQVMFLFAPDNHVATLDAKADLKTPADIGFGLAVKPSNKLTITADVAYTAWSRLDSILIRLDGTDPSGAEAQDNTIVLEWDNAVRFSAGLEYWAIEPLAIRLGYYHDPSPVPDETFTPLIPDSGNKESFDIGAALRVSALELSYNFEYMAFAERKITTLSDPNGDGYFDNYPGVFKSKLYASHVSLTYRF